MSPLAMLLRRVSIMLTVGGAGVPIDDRETTQEVVNSTTLSTTVPAEEETASLAASPSAKIP